MADTNVPYTASSTIGTKLVVGSTPVYIKDYPDLGGKPEQIQSTTLIDQMHTFVQGVQSFEDVSFTANFEPSLYATLSAITEAQDCSVEFFKPSTTSQTSGTTVAKFSFKAQVSVFATGGGVNEVRNMTITLTPNTAITMSTT